MIELFTARSGAPSLKVDGVAMHSPYDPAREAERFVRETIGEERPSTVVVLGECVGHVVEAVRRQRPRARLLSVVYSSEIAQASPLAGVPAWDPGSGRALPEFLRLHLGELQLEGLRVIEWPPAARAFPSVSRFANEELRQVVQELNGSFVTTVSSGRTWLRNAFANFLHAQPVMTGRLAAADRPIVVVAPGPSLRDAAPLLAEVRQRVDLWALPSSCPFLLDQGMSPDLVVMTDSGFYSMHHLHFAVPPCPVAMPLSAARGSWSLPTVDGPTGVPVFFLGQPVFFEKALLDAAHVSAPLIPPHGTVAATAIDLALVSTMGPVIAAGLDMGSRDLLSHALPNAFDTLLHLQASRLQPHSSLTFGRAAASGTTRDARAPGMRTSSALRTYAGWFDAGFQENGGRLHRLLPSGVPLARMPALDAEGLRGLLRGAAAAPGGTSLHANPDFPTLEERRRIARLLLAEWSSAISAMRDSLGAAFSPFGDAPPALELAHILAPRRLVDAMKKAREGDAAGARGSAAEMFTECIAFLRQFGDKTLG